MAFHLLQRNPRNKSSMGSYILPGEQLQPHPKGGGSGSGKGMPQVRECDPHPLT